MADLDARPLAITDTVAVWDVLCPGGGAHPGEEESVTATHLVFPYQGAYVHHVGRAESVAEANQVIVLNEAEPYRVSHPFVPGLLDLAALRDLTGKVTLPVNAMVGPGAPDVAALRAAGVRRVSLGQSIAQAAYTLARKAAAEALGAGSYDAISGADPFGDINGAFPVG